jgi:hypothetical protein
MSAVSAVDFTHFSFCDAILQTIINPANIG